MVVITGRNPDTNEECHVELDPSTSMEHVKIVICGRLGVEPKKYHLVYKDEIVLYQKTLQELHFSSDPKPVISISRIAKPAKPISAFSFLGIPGLGAGGSSNEGEGEEESKFPQPLPRYTEAGVLDDPRNFSIAKNSSFAFRVHTMTKSQYSPQGSEKLMQSLTSELQRIVDSLSYDEIEKLATDCLQINQQRMETLRDQYYCSFEK